MAEYALTPFDHIVKWFHDGTVTSFRDDEPSNENIAYQAWLAVPNVPDPYVENTAAITITARQFWMRLAALGLISETEATDAMTGDLPNAIKHYINVTLPMPQRYSARMFFLDGIFFRAGIAVVHLKVIYTLNDVQMDAFFHDAALL